MLIRAADTETKPLPNCHGGEGSLAWRVVLEEAVNKGIAFVHDNILDPGVTIGEHIHDNDEELYMILEGTGTMRIDGVDHEVGPGDVCITRAGHSHGLANTGPVPIRQLVIGVR